jgi:hypothetical protein
VSQYPGNDEEARKVVSLRDAARMPFDELVWDTNTKHRGGCVGVGPAWTKSCGAT